MKQITNKQEAFRLALIWVAIGLVAGLTVGGLCSPYQSSQEVYSRLVNRLNLRITGEGITWRSYTIKETGAESYPVPKSPTDNGNPAAVQSSQWTRVRFAMFSPENQGVEVEIQDGLATIDLNKRRPSPQRAWGEALTVSALVNTLTKFPEVDQVRSDRREKLRLSPGTGFKSAPA